MARIRALVAKRKEKRAEKAKILWTPPGTEEIAQKILDSTEKPKRKPRRKSSERWLLVQKLDKLYSLVIRARDSKITGGLCVFGCGRPIQCAFHFVTRAKYIVRWDLQNAVGSCYAQNYENEFNPHPYIQWYRKNYGDKVYDDLIARSNKIAKFSNTELLEIKARLESELSRSS
jgi:hypothetical protein